MAKTVAAAEFQVHPLELLEEATENQEEVVVLKDGKPIGKLTPIEVPTEAGRPRTIEELRALGGRILGDIIEPLDEWDAAKCVTVEEFRRRYPVKILGDIMEPMDDE